MPGARRCNLCERPPPFSPVYGRAGFTLVRCPGCGLVFQDPPPSAGTMEGLYYFGEEHARRLQTDLRAYSLGLAREKLDLVLGAGIAPRGRLLDVGCSTGAWLGIARDAGWDGSGVEIGEAFAAVARASGFEVRTGSLEDAAPSLASTPFDLITFWDVLEHLHDPLGTLRLAATLLAPGGAVAFTMPNVDGLFPRATFRLLARRTGVWEHPELPAHLYDFSAATASLLAERAGLAPCAARTTSVPFSHYLSTSLRIQLSGRRRGRLLRLAFEGLRLVLYPAARLLNRGNALFVAAKPSPGRG